MAVPAAHAWSSNAALLADVAKLGYVRGVVVDVTYGRGAWWSVFRPGGLVAHDLSLDGVDFRQLPEATASVDTVAFDPPYKLNGTPTLGDFDARYGVDTPMRWQDRRALIVDGIGEAARVLRPGGHCLVKVQDQVVAGRVRWLTLDVIERAGAVGLVLVDRFDFLGMARPQPGGRRQRHAHGRPSTLLVFERVSP